MPFSERKKTLLTIGSILLILGAYRLAISTIQIPHDTPDTWSYWNVANFITGNYNVHNGLRTPGYPFLLLLTGTSVQTIYFVQSVLGILTSVLLYLLGRRLGLPHLAAFAAALLPGLDRGLIGHEFRVMTESLSGFLLVLSALCLERSLARRTFVWPILTGLILGWLILTRTQFLFIVPFLALLWLPQRLDLHNLKAMIRPCALLYLPLLLIITSWAFTNYRHLGTFTLSTQGGASLTNHMGPVMEQASDRYAVIRDIYLAHRARLIERQGDHQNTIWEATNEMEATLGIDRPTLSGELKGLSLELIRKEPLFYAKSVWQSWLRAPMWVYNYQIKRDQPPSNLPPSIHFLLNRSEELLTRIISPFFNLCLWVAFACWLWQSYRQPASLASHTFRLTGLLLILALGNMTIPHIIEGTMESWRLYSPAQWLAPLLVIAVILPRLAQPLPPPAPSDTTDS